MSVRVEFEGNYEEREKKINEAVSLLKGKFGSEARIRAYNPKTLGDYLLLSILSGIEDGVRSGGREAAHKIVDYVFDNLTPEKTEK